MVRHSCVLLSPLGFVVCVGLTPGYRAWLVGYYVICSCEAGLVFEGPGVVKEYVGGYLDWLRQRPEPAAEKPPRSPPKTKPAASVSRALQSELRALPGKIEKLEARIETFQLRFSEPDYYQQDAETIRAEQQQLQALETELAALYQRWEELEDH